jgi:hypothetical protein
MNEENLQGRVCQNDGKLPSTTTRSALDILDKHDLNYLLGFTYADGNIFKRKEWNSYRMTWTSIDLDLLEWIKSILKVDTKILQDKTGCYRYMFCNTDLALDLMGRGIVPNKTYMNIFPTIDINYFHDFVRGFFDGDGNIYRTKDQNNTLHLTFVGKLKENLQSLGNILKDELGLIPKIYTHHETCYRLRYCLFESLSLYHWMYNSPSFFLKRKKDTFEQWLTDRNQKNFGRRICEVCKNEYSVLHDKSHVCHKCKTKIKMKT